MTSSPTRSRATPSSSTRSPTSGTATASPWRAGSTSGSTRASPRTPSGCGARTRSSGTAQEIFDFWYEVFPADDPFWSVVIGDPGPDQLFDFAVYIRGAMTLHQLRLAVGDDDFFEIMQTWAADHAGGNVTTDEFIALAESISGEDLGDALRHVAVHAGQARGGRRGRSGGTCCSGRRAARTAGGPQPDRAIRKGFVGRSTALIADQSGGRPRPRQGRGRFHAPAGLKALVGRRRNDARRGCGRVWHRCVWRTGAAARRRGAGRQQARNDHHARDEGSTHTAVSFSVRPTTRLGFGTTADDARFR